MLAFSLSQRCFMGIGNGEEETYGSFSEVLFGFLVGHVACRELLLRCRMLEIGEF